MPPSHPPDQQHQQNHGTRDGADPAGETKAGINGLFDLAHFLHAPLHEAEVAQGAGPAQRGAEAVVVVDGLDPFLLVVDAGVVAVGAEDEVGDAVPGQVEGGLGEGDVGVDAGEEGAALVEALLGLGRPDVERGDGFHAVAVGGLPEDVVAPDAVDGFPDLCVPAALLGLGRLGLGLGLGLVVEALGQGFELAVVVPQPPAVDPVVFVVAVQLVLVAVEPAAVGLQLGLVVLQRVAEFLVPSGEGAGVGLEVRPLVVEAPIDGFEGRAVVAEQAVVAVESRAVGGVTGVDPGEARVVYGQRVLVGAEAVVDGAEAALLGLERVALLVEPPVGVVQALPVDAQALFVVAELGDVAAQLVGVMVGPCLQNFEGYDAAFAHLAVGVGAAPGGLSFAVAPGGFFVPALAAGAILAVLRLASLALHESA
ncbi:hypothetical protein PG996_010977 [Apiospora saccharicola]|uniref:Uncharacterized protein n=1 Tax=Apiospora saccharicola TaxID=335842 RepID=A0ABR1UDQ8_9PEZI